MSAAYKRKGKHVRTVKVPKRVDGSVEWIARSTGTRDRVTAKKMQEMVAALGPAGKGAWDLLEKVTASPPAWTLKTLWEKWIAVPGRHDPRTGAPLEPSADERILALRGQLEEVDLAPLVDTWFTVLTGPSEGVSDDTAKHYRSAVRLLVPKGEPCPRAQLTDARIRTWLEEMDDVEPGTVRKRGIGLRRFITWLRNKGVLRFDPMAEITLPQQGEPLAHYLEVADAIRLADAQPGPFRLFGYVVPGTAMEVTTGLSVRVRDVSRLDRTIHAPGTKTYNRDRIVRVADFAWDAVLELLKGKHPDARLLDGIADRWTALDAHTEARDALVAQGHRVYAEMAGGVPHDYTLRDHRHTWAVRAARSGWPIEAIARQLGHVNGILALRVYGRFVPRQDEIDRWEKMATARDQALAKEQKE